MDKYDDMFKRETIEPFNPIPALITTIAVLTIIIFALVRNCGGVL